MITEEQAREKWCPHARVSAANGPCHGNHANNRYADGCVPAGGQANCIASDCMAWRWDTEHNDLLIEEARVAYQETDDYKPNVKPPMHDSAEMEDYYRQRCGYCGLAGNP